MTEMIEIEKAKDFVKNLKVEGEGEFEEEREGGEGEGGEGGGREGGYFGEEEEEEVYLECGYCLVRLIQVGCGWWCCVLIY